MNKTSEFKRIWYAGERELSALNYRYKRAFVNAHTPRQIVIINKAYDTKKAEIERRRIEALKGLA